jgi:integrase
MGWVEPRITKAGKQRFAAKYRDLKGNKRGAGTYATEQKAINAWHQAEAKIALGKIGDPRRGKQKFSQYVLDEWFPNHVIEASTRQSYHYLLHAYLLPEFGKMRMMDILPSHVRAWVVRLKAQSVGAASIRQCKVVLNAIFTTALNDQIVFLHAGKGVATPKVVKKPKVIVTASQFDAIYNELEDGMYRLLVETDIESGLRWSELTELRPRDLNRKTGKLTVARAVVKLNPKFHPEGGRFLVKDYPKDGEWRTVMLALHLVKKINYYIDANNIGDDDLLFEYKPPTEPRHRLRMEDLPDPVTLGYTEPNEKGSTYRHGTISAYSGAKCRCEHCRNAMSAYRAERRAAGKDNPRKPRTVNTDGHIDADWFRRSIWYKAVEASGIGLHITPHGLRHAHASWLLAGGADLQVVKERLGHGSIETTAGYLHTLPGADDAALAALDQIRGQRDAAADDAEQSAIKKKAKKAKKAVKAKAAESAELDAMKNLVVELQQMLASVKVDA